MQWSRRHLRWRRIAEIMCYSATNGGLIYHERMDKIVFTCAQGNGTRIVVLFRETASVDVSWWCGEVSVVVKSWKLSVTLMKCLLREVVPFLRQNCPNLIFQHDNARPHAARVVTNFLNQNNVQRLPWPAMLSDLTPIEHLWDYHSRRIHNGNE